MQLENLQTKFLGKNTIYYNEINSTQTEIWRLIKKSSSPNGTLVFADIQTKGVGTHGRVWHTDEKGNIAFSFFIQMDCNIKKLDGLTIQIANIIVDILKRKYNITLSVKEPNDIVYNNKKIGGILTQTRVICEKVKYLVIGIGINTIKENFTNDIKTKATSIKKEFKINVNVMQFIVEFCNIFENVILERIGN